MIKTIVSVLLFGGAIFFILLSLQGVGDISFMKNVVISRIQVLNINMKSIEDSFCDSPYYTITLEDFEFTKGYRIALIFMGLFSLITGLLWMNTDEYY